MPNPYYPRPFSGEPRLTKDWLTTINLLLRGGHSTNGHNGHKQKVNTLNIYGCENFYQMAENAPEATLNCNPNGFLNTLWQQQPHSTNFGKIAINGKFAMLEFYPTITQNFKHGLFLSLTVPIKHFSVKELTFFDQTTSISAPNATTYREWQSFFNNIENNLQPYGVCLGPTKSSGLGDTQLMGGWTYSYEETEVLDFIDFTVALGANIPTSKTVSPYIPLSIPFGFNHPGFPFIGMISCGFFDWLTLGLNGGFLWLNNKKEFIGMKTTPEQQGLTHLARGCAMVKPGTTWFLDPYIKCDHLIGGFSLTLGFSYDHANKTTISPCDQTIFDKTVVNSDERYGDWHMTAFHFVLDFDFASFKHSWAPRIAFTVDKSMRGKRIFDTALFGAAITADIEW